LSANGKMSSHKLHGLWALTNRELKKWYKAPVVFLLTIIQPILWMGLLGKAMNIGGIFNASSIPPIVLNPPLSASQLAQLGTIFQGLSNSIMANTFGVTEYFCFMAMGMIVFTTLFTTAFSGMSVVWDRRLGFMNKVLSTPVSRSVIILSKVLSATLRSMFQAVIVIVIAYAFGLQFGTNFNIISLLGVFAIVFLIGMGLSSMFIAINLRATRMETPQAIINLITLPLMFASNAFFPINLMPNWLQAVANVNPMSYTTDAVRRLTIFNDGFSQIPLDFAYVGIFAIVVTIISIILSWRYLNK
jgi:ABC-2 type transport system permease protein